MNTELLLNNLINQLNRKQKNKHTRSIKGFSGTLKSQLLAQLEDANIQKLRNEVDVSRIHSCELPHKNSDFISKQINLRQNLLSEVDIKDIGNKPNNHNS